MRDLFFALAGCLTWVALRDSGAVPSILFGSILGVVSGRLLFGPAAPGRAHSPFRIAWVLLRLTGRFVSELVIANVQQLRLVLSPRLEIEPRWLDYRSSLVDLRLRAVLGLLISMTPGTVTESLQGQVLHVHLLDSSEPDAVAERIRDRFESLLLEIDL